MSQTAARDRSPRFKMGTTVKPTTFRCLEYKVLVRPKAAEEHITLAGGFKLLKADATRELEQASAMEGEIVELSPFAFSYETWPDGHEAPKVGDYVIFARFAGAVVRDDDGTELRIMNDKDIMAVRRSA